LKVAIVVIILILSLVPALADTVRYYDYETGIELSQEESTGHKFIQSIYNRKTNMGYTCTFGLMMNLGSVLRRHATTMTVRLSNPGNRPTI
jgi:uncharacterized protein YpuA (DUF1002 family)